MILYDYTLITSETEMAMAENLLVLFFADCEAVIYCELKR